MRIIERLDDIAGGYRAVLCDLWGVYHDGIRPHAAALAALRAYRARGGIVVLFTNAPRSEAEVRRFLARIGAPDDTHDGIMSSGIAAQAALASGALGQRFHYLGPARDLPLMTDLGLAPVALEAAEAVLCTGLVDDRTETPADYAPTLQAIRARDLPFLCANPDIVVDRGDQRLWCAGALARDYAALGGRVVWFGKPHLPIYDQALALVNRLAGEPVPRAGVLAIGDGPATDLAGARDAGLDALLITGGLMAEALGTGAPDPDRLARLLRPDGLSPAYAMGRLA